MLKIGLFIGFMLLISSCDNSKSPELSEGIWLGELEVQDSEILPFNFQLRRNETGKLLIDIYNASEVIKVDEVTIKNDSIIIRTPVFEGYIAGIFTENSIKGKFIKESLERTVLFKATFGTEERFNTFSKPQVHVSGIWETEFSPNTEDSYLGKGIFTQKDNKVVGTFRTTTGDYRYLEGVIDGDIMKVSTFDGAHAFLFTAKVTDSSLKGTFYSGNHFQEPFIAKRNERFELPNADSLTYLKKGYDKLEFSFPDSNGTLISLDDDKFKDKV
ncbi:MAG: TlpA family protein disulfide reductase, partial [Maribacter sp.]|nr:TlpA family protein disulfide reductase [Maribacter sp.]